ncbi:MAG: M67 family metallopeptidase [Saprospiraceae bacterium]
MTTTIDFEILEAIQSQLESSYPHEACGFILGHEHKGKRRITKSIEVENKSVENQRRRFIIDPLDYMKVERQALKEGLILLGIYHSHPDHPAIPSIHDLEFAQPFFSYLIHSINSGKLTDTRSYRLQNGKFVEEIISAYSYRETHHINNTDHNISSLQKSPGC